MHLHGFFVATEVQVQGDAISLIDGAFGRITPSELPTSQTLTAILSFKADEGDPALDSLSVGWANPDGSISNVGSRLQGLRPELRIYWAPVTVNIFDEGEHHLLLFNGDDRPPIATYPIDVVILPPPRNR